MSIWHFLTPVLSVGKRFSTVKLLIVNTLGASYHQSVSKSFEMDPGVHVASWSHGLTPVLSVGKSLSTAKPLIVNTLVLGLLDIHIRCLHFDDLPQTL